MNLAYQVEIPMCMRYYLLVYTYALDVEVKNSNKEIQALILSRKVVPNWKKENSRNSEISPNGIRIDDVFRPTVSDAYAFVLNNQFKRQ